MPSSALDKLCKYIYTKIEIYLINIYENEQKKM